MTRPEAQSDEGLGSAALAKLYHTRSAFSLTPADGIPDAPGKSAVDEFGVFYQHLLGLRGNLRSNISAPVVPLLIPRKPAELVPNAAKTDVGLLNEAA